MGKGKAKIEMKKIESLQARNVCFSKRRQGLFKKAAELERLFPGVQIAAVVFSPAGNPYLFGGDLLNQLLEKSRNASNGEEEEKGEEEPPMVSAPPVETAASSSSNPTTGDMDYFDGLDDEEAFVNQFLIFDSPN